MTDQNLFENFRLKFQRDINRLSDTDRNSRKRGLQNLLEELPWTKKVNQDFMIQLFDRDMFHLILARVADPVEKCRELSLKILAKAIYSFPSIADEIRTDILLTLCNRLDEVPYPEPTEELRLQILELMSKFTQNSQFDLCLKENINKFLSTIGKALLDSFPSAKRESADILVVVSSRYPTAIRLGFKIVLKGLQLNCIHQHTKVRVSNIKVKSIFFERNHF